MGGSNSKKKKKDNNKIQISDPTFSPSSPSKGPKGTTKWPPSSTPQENIQENPKVARRVPPPPPTNEEDHISPRKKNPQNGLICSECGTNCLPSTKFCSSCGNKLQSKVGTERSFESRKEEQKVEKEDKVRRDKFANSDQRNKEPKKKNNFNRRETY